MLYGSTEEKYMKTLEKLRKNDRVSLYLEDPIYRTKLNLNAVTALNLLYAVIKLVSGVHYRSDWLAAFGLYFLVLTGLRLSLASFFRRKPLGTDLIGEYRRSRLVGVLLLLMDLVLVVIIVRMIAHNESNEYACVLIYAMAAYTFYAVIFAVINILRARGHESPVCYAVKAVDLTAAMAAMLSLTAALIARFGENGPFRRTMLAICGAAFRGIILWMSMSLICRSTKRLHALGKMNHWGLFSQQKSILPTMIRTLRTKETNNFKKL